MRYYKAPYTEEFKHQMVELVKAGRKVKELAKEFGCHESSIQGWVKQKESLTQTPSVLSIDEQEELKLLRKRLKQVEMERDILAKATAWFAHNGEAINK
jgi:transposase